MSPLSTLSTLGPYHILSYGTLLGTSFYQSFINGIVSYRALPRPQFSTLQQTLTPIYFAMQTILPLVMALTYPAPRTISPLGGSTPPSGFMGVLEPANRTDVLLPILAMAVCGAVNWGILGPTTTSVMGERKKLGAKEGKHYYESGEPSEQMKVLNQRFSMWHGASALINMVGLGWMVWYGVLLSDRLV